MADHEAVEAYRNKWYRCTPATTADIEAAEDVLGVRFRPELRRLLSICAGGRPELYWYEGSGLEWGVGEVLNLRPRDVMNLQLTTQSLRNFGLPRTYIAFAVDNGNAAYATVNKMTGAVWEFLVPERRLRILGASIDEVMGSLGLDFLDEKNANIPVLRKTVSRSRTQKPSEKTTKKRPKRK